MREEVENRQSPPSRRRGSKPHDARVYAQRVRSPPSRRRGSKHRNGGNQGRTEQSPPSRRRGSKRALMAVAEKRKEKSPPSRRRGSKQCTRRWARDRRTVASITEAWIETGTHKRFQIPLHVASITEAWIETPGRWLCPRPPWGRLHHGGVDRNSLIASTGMSTPCRLHHGGVDRNLKRSTRPTPTLVASITEAWIETFVPTDTAEAKSSPPSRRRGSKL